MKLSNFNQLASTPVFWSLVQAKPSDINLDMDLFTMQFLFILCVFFIYV